MTSAAEMKEAVDEHFPGADVTVMAAAVADFTFAAPAARKVEKKPSRPDWRSSAPDILKELGGRKRPGQILVGFAAGNGRGRGRRPEKAPGEEPRPDRRQRRLPEGTGFEADVNQAVLIDRRGKSRKTDILSKRALAAVIWDAIEGLREKKK